jgi:hypothetical protein
MMMIVSYFIWMNEGQRNWWKATELHSKVDVIFHASWFHKFRSAIENPELTLYATLVIDMENTGISVDNLSCLW